MIKTYALKPNDSHKSFYGKATVFETDNAYILRSYETDVMYITKATRRVHRTWSGESATTMRHVNAFLAFVGVDGGGVKWWREQKVERFPWTRLYFGKGAAT